MSERNPNTVSAAMVALYSVLVAVCLIIAGLAPGRWFQLPRVQFAMAVVGVVGLPVLLRLAERSRIREAVRRMPATMVSLRRLPFWKQGWSYRSSRLEAKYEVFFTDITGREFRAICRSGFLRGVVWLDVRPIEQAPDSWPRARDNLTA